MSRTVLLFGGVITAALIAILYGALGNDPQHIDSPLVGAPAPNFALKQVGRAANVDLASYRGTPVVLNFWATWCRPCWEEHPLLTQAAQLSGGRVQFVGVVFQDDEKKIIDFLQQRGWAYPTLIDDRGKTAIAYGVGGVPPKPSSSTRTERSSPSFDGPMSYEALMTNLQKADAMKRLLLIATFALVASAQMRAPDAEQFVGPPRGTPLAGARARNANARSRLDAPMPPSARASPSPTRRPRWAVNMRGQVRELLQRGFHAGADPQLLRAFLRPSSSCSSQSSAA